MIRVDIKPELLTWARERARLDVNVTAEVLVPFMFLSRQASPGTEPVVREIDLHHVLCRGAIAAA